MSGYDMVVGALNSLVSRSDEFSPLRDVVLGIYGKTPSLEEHDCFMSHGTFCVHKVGGGYSPRIEIQQLPADSKIFIVRLIVVVKEEGGISYKEIRELTGAAHVATEMFAHVYSGFLKDGRPGHPLSSSR